MAGVLSYALSLKTSDFNGKLRLAELQMAKFTGATTTAAKTIRSLPRPMKDVARELDAIDAKAAKASSAVSNLSSKSSRAANVLFRFRAAASAAGGALGGMRRPLGSVAGGIKKVSLSGLKTTAVLGTMGVALGAIGAAAGVAALAFKSLQSAANFEQTEVSFRVLIGNAKEATATLNRLRKFANSTPFEFKEVAAAGKKLLAMGSSTGQLTAELRALGDVASGLNTPLSELTFIYGKMRSKGKLMAEEINQLMERGVPIVSLLAQKYKVADAAIYKMASEGKIGFSDMQEALIKMTTAGGKFHGMMKEQSGTTLGLWSTLKSAVDELYITLGEPINDAIKPVLAGAIVQMQDLGARTGAFFGLLAEASQKGGFAAVLGAGLVLAASKFINVIAGGIRGTVAYLGAALPVIMDAAKTSLFNENNMQILKHIFITAGELLKAGILSGALAVAEALSLPTKGLEEAIRGAKLSAELSLDHAAGKYGPSEQFPDGFGGPSAFDAGEVVSGAVTGVMEANKAGNAAAKEASSKPLIDLAPKRKKLADASSHLDQIKLKTVLNGAPKTEEKKVPLKVDKDALPGQKKPPAPKEPDAGGGSPVRGPLTAVKSASPRLQPLTLAQRSRKARSARRSAADGGIGAFKIHSFARQNKISFKEAKEKLTASGRAASPRQSRRNAAEKAARDAAAKAATEGTLLGIKAKLDNFAVI